MGKHILSGHEWFRPDGFEESLKRDGHASMERREVVREFSSAMEMLHWCNENRVFEHVPGASRKLEYLHLGKDGDPRNDYRRVDTHSDFRPSTENLSAMRKALARYCEILHYLRDVEPEWQEGREIHYADNSIERVDMNKYGGTRRVTLRHPSGDICY